MKSIQAIFFFLLLFSIAAVTWANEGHLDLPLQSRLLFAQDGHFIIHAQSDFAGLDYQILAQNQEGEPIQGFSLAAKPAKEGILIRIKKTAGARRFSGTPKVTLTVGALHDVVLEKVEGHFSISNLRGAVSGSVVAGAVDLVGCSGPVHLSVKRGTVSVSNHLSEGQPFDLMMKQGNVSIELGGVKAPGPGRVKLENGRLTWRMRALVPVDFHGEVMDGLITCNLPLTRPDPRVITFTSMGGLHPWRIHLEKGVINLELPKPKVTKRQGNK